MAFLSFDPFCIDPFACQKSRTKPWDDGKHIISTGNQTNITYMPPLVRWGFWCREKTAKKKQKNNVENSWIDSDSTLGKAIDVGMMKENNSCYVLCMFYCLTQRNPWYQRSLCKNFPIKNFGRIHGFCKRPQVLGMVLQLLHSMPVVAVFQGGYRGFGNDLPYPPNWWTKIL